jgi:hypothetical protein
LTAAEPVADASSAAVPVAAAAAVRVAAAAAVRVAAAAAVPAAAVKAKNRFPFTIAPLWSARRDHGALGPRGAYPAEISAS